MYRIFCENFINYKKQNTDSGYRSTIVRPFDLIVNLELFNREKKEETILYKKLCDILYYMEQNTEKFPRFQAFLWTLESRGMVSRCYGNIPENDLIELGEIVSMFLKLLYWDDTNVK